jgi:NAD(P)-dependent dehydrogenase (short-subunit alcohol dehydrogenase family)
MSLVLVTGSTDGIGARIADVLAGHRHDVVLHARDAGRAQQRRATAPPGARVVVGDFASLASTREMAAALRRLGTFDVIVHNAGWAGRDGPRPVTEDGLERTFQVNVLAPYLLTASVPLPARLVFVSSDSIVRGRIDLADLQHERSWSPDAAYADSKLALTALAFGLARRYPAVLCTAVHPGWIRTKMTGLAGDLDGSGGDRLRCVLPRPRAGRGQPTRLRRGPARSPAGALCRALRCGPAVTDRSQALGAGSDSTATGHLTGGNKLRTGPRRAGGGPVGVSLRT